MYTERPDFQLGTPPGVKLQFPPEVIAHLSGTSARNHEFSTADGTCKINLTRTFLSMSTTNYRQWENFASRFTAPYSTLLEVYRPPFFARIGLRYVDIFHRSKLGLENTNWTELIQPYFLGILSTGIAEQVRSSESIYEVNLTDNQSIARIAAALVVDATTKEQCYMIDSDLYNPRRTLPDNAFETLEFLHHRATRLIQWIVTPTLHAAMEPHQI